VWVYGTRLRVQGTLHRIQYSASNAIKCGKSDDTWHNCGYADCRTQQQAAAVSLHRMGGLTSDDLADSFRRLSFFPKVPAFTNLSTPPHSGQNLPLPLFLKALPAPVVGNCAAVNFFCDCHTIVAAASHLAARRQFVERAASRCLRCSTTSELRGRIVTICTIVLSDRVCRRVALVKAFKS
jgi:hypothetical protein